MPRSLHCVLLAGGEGKRMKSAVPKVLIELLGRPLLGHVLDAAAPLRPVSRIVVGGRHLPTMRKVFGQEPGLAFARQSKPLGTAHAVKQALKLLPQRSADVLILCGDVPLMRAETLRDLVAHHRRSKAGLTVATALVDDPTGLGRILRDPRGRFVAIREERDCAPEEKEVREINAGLYVAQVDLLHRILPRIKRGNAQGEYYLTDLVHLADRPVTAFAMPDPTEARGINRPAELDEAREILHHRLVEQHRERGVRIAHPHQVVLEVGATIGEGTVIHPFSVVERAAIVPAYSTVGPFAHVRDGSEVVGAEGLAARDGLPSSAPRKAAKRPVSSHRSSLRKPGGGGASPD